MPKSAIAQPQIRMESTKMFGKLSLFLLKILESFAIIVYIFVKKEIDRDERTGYHLSVGQSVKDNSALFVNQWSNYIKARGIFCSFYSGEDMPVLLLKEK